MNVVSENGFNAVTSSGASADLSRLGRIALNIALNLLCLCKSLDGCDQLTLYVLFTAMVFNRLDAPLLKIPSCKSTTFSGSPHRPFGCTILLVSVFLLVKCSLIPGLFQVSSTPALWGSISTVHEGLKIMICSGPRIIYPGSTWLKEDRYDFIGCQGHPGSLQECTDQILDHVILILHFF